jgi:small-conductance mechanosensitive channel
VEELVDYWPLAVRLGWFLLAACLVLAVGLLVVQPAVARAVRARNPNNPTLREAVSQYVRLLVAVVALAVGTATAGYGGLLADSALVVAAATLAIGVGAQTVVGSPVSGFVLVVDPEFNVGDYIEWPGGEGTVRSITLRVTRVFTRDGALVTVPDTALTGDVVERPYARGRCRLIDRVVLAEEADLDRATAVLTDALAEVDAVAEAPTPRACVEELSPQGAVYGLHYWVESPRERYPGGPRRGHPGRRPGARRRRHRRQPDAGA